MFRMGALAVLRSMFKKGRHIGLMITASHNPACDNGVKLVDPEGEMLAQDWEGHATTLANVSDADLVSEIEKLVKELGICASQSRGVVIGMDTRPSSARLHQCAIAGVMALGGRVEDCGVVTTPVLHYRVVTMNDGGAYGIPTNEGYTNKLLDAFTSLAGNCEGTPSAYSDTLLLDGANGVGGNQIALMVDRLAPYLKVRRYNCDGKGTLNFQCGADYVKSQQKWPEGVPREPLTRCVSLDGDADRLVYSYLDSAMVFHLLDGDKIALLIAKCIKQRLSRAAPPVRSLRLGLVQTAYANGASTSQAKAMAVPVTCALTGVKFLHKAALDYDIGVYFEANGHGTVTLSDHALTAIRECGEKGCVESQRLAAMCRVINTCVGDAISDMLLVELILREEDWGVVQWEAMYQDLPNKLVKVKVLQRSVITTSNAERTCVTPATAQPAIDALVAKYQKARAFIRPSGTEDVVRVYAEASTHDQTEQLALEVSRVVFDLCGGVGERP